MSSKLVSLPRRKMTATTKEEEEREERERERERERGDYTMNGLFVYKNTVTIHPTDVNTQLITHDAQFTHEAHRQKHVRDQLVFV